VEQVNLKPGMKQYWMYDENGENENGEMVSGK